MQRERHLKQNEEKKRNETKFENSICAYLHKMRLFFFFFFFVIWIYSLESNECWALNDEEFRLPKWNERRREWNRCVSVNDWLVWSSAVFFTCFFRRNEKRLWFDCCWLGSISILQQNIHKKRTNFFFFSSSSYDWLTCVGGRGALRHLVDGFNWVFSVIGHERPVDIFG